MGYDVTPLGRQLADRVPFIKLVGAEKKKGWANPASIVVIIVLNLTFKWESHWHIRLSVRADMHTMPEIDPRGWNYGSRIPRSTDEYRRDAH